jgi:hypothetical protein
MKKYKTFLCSTLWVFLISGCSNYKDEILLIEKSVINNGGLCISLKTDDKCMEYVKSLNELTTKFEEHGDEIFKQAKAGDEKSQKIMLLTNDIKKIGAEMSNLNPNK